MVLRKIDDCRSMSETYGLTHKLQMHVPVTNGNHLRAFSCRAGVVFPDPEFEDKVFAEVIDVFGSTKDILKGEGL